MLLSSGVVWRYRSFAEFRSQCPGGDERLQRLVWERLDDALDWLVARGAPVVWDETGNPRTVGKRWSSWPRSSSPTRSTSAPTRNC